MNYENEYLPKIEYWTSKLVEAVRNKDIKKIDHIHQTLGELIQLQFDNMVKIENNS